MERPQPDYHIPVLLNEVLEYLDVSPDGVYIDGTLGGGGHAEAILQKLSVNGKLIGLDQDEEAIQFAGERLKGFGNQFVSIQENFSNIDIALQNLGIEQIDGMVLDLGVSSHQIDDVSRGFSYAAKGPLSMKMDLSVQFGADHVVNTFSEEALANLIYHYGEERASRKIARAIVRARIKDQLIETTDELAKAVCSVTPSRFHIKTLSRVFQAIRIEVNDELDALRTCLEKVYGFLKMGGRIVIISYHSLEDRLVKRYFKGEVLSFNKNEYLDEKTDYSFKRLTSKPVLPNETEIQMNSRARSAKLRAAVKIQGSI